MSEIHHLTPITIMSHIKEALLDMPPQILLSTLAASMYFISQVSGSYFFFHSRDEFPRIRSQGVSIWIDHAGKYPIFFIQHDDVELDHELEFDVEFFNSECSISIEGVYTTSNFSIAKNVFCILLRKAEQAKELEQNLVKRHSNLAKLYERKIVNLIG